MINSSVHLPLVSILWRASTFCLREKFQCFQRWPNLGTLLRVNQPSRQLLGICDRLSSWRSLGPLMVQIQRRLIWIWKLESGVRIKLLDLSTYSCQLLWSISKLMLNRSASSAKSANLCGAIRTSTFDSIADGSSKKSYWKGNFGSCDSFTECHLSLTESLDSESWRKTDNWSRVSTSTLYKR